MRLALALFLLAGVFACGGGDGDQSDDPAADRILQTLAYIDDGQFGRAWEDLHPAHQELVNRDHYVSCAEQSGSVGIEDVEVVESYPETVTLPGTDETADTMAVTVKYTVRRGLLTNEETNTFHAAEVAGRWVWLLSDPTEYEDC